MVMKIEKFQSFKLSEIFKNSEPYEYTQFQMENKYKLQINSAIDKIHSLNLNWFHFFIVWLIKSIFDLSSLIE